MLSQNDLDEYTYYMNYLTQYYEMLRKSEEKK